MFEYYVFMRYFFEVNGHHRDLHGLTPSFPTRRDSDLSRHVLCVRKSTKRTTFEEEDMTNKQGIVAALLATTAFASPAFAQSTDTQTAPEPPVAAATPTSKIGRAHF